MVKPNPGKLIQRQRTANEMRIALATFTAGQEKPTDVDDPAVILNDCIEELLEKRTLIEQIRGFVSVWSAKLLGKQM